jgi:hypothetical protein
MDDLAVMVGEQKTKILIVAEAFISCSFFIFHSGPSQDQGKSRQ